MSDDDDFEDETEDDGDGDEIDAPAPRARARKPRKPRNYAVPPVPALGDVTAEDDVDGLAAEQARYEQRLRDGYTKPIPPGTPKARGIEGWDQEYRIIERHGHMQAGRILFHRLRPTGPDNKPLNLGSVLPEQLGGDGQRTPGQVMFDYLRDNFADPRHECVIGWTFVMDGVRRRLGEMSLPIKAAPAPERRADGGLNGASSAVPPPQGVAPWGSPSAHYPPQGYGYPPPGYPGGWGYGGAPPQSGGQSAKQDPPPPPPAPPLPANMPPELAAHVNWLQSQVQNLSGQLFDAREKMSGQEVAEVRAEIGRVNANILETIKQWASPQHAPAPAAAEPPPKPPSFIDQVNELKAQAQALEGLKTAFGGGPQPPPPPPPPAEPVEAADDPVQVIKSDDGTVAIIERATGDLKFGQSAFMNMGLIKGLFSGLVAEIKDAAIEVKRAGPPQQGQGGQGNGNPPDKQVHGSGGGGRGWK